MSLAWRPGASAGLGPRDPPTTHAVASARRSRDDRTSTREQTMTRGPFSPVWVPTLSLLTALFPTSTLAHRPATTTRVMNVGGREAEGGPDFRISAGTSSGGAAFGFGPSLTVDPTAAGRLLAAANAFGATAGLLRARSIDGGVTWVATTDPVGEGFGITSPQVACDSFVNCFLGFLDQTDL